MVSSLGDAVEAVWRPEIARMRIPSLGRDVAALLATLAAATGARRALELGTAIGYSAAYLAVGMGSSGRVTAVELDARRAAVARRLWAAAGLADRIELLEGDALLVAPTLQAGYDLVFVDMLWELGRRGLGEQLGRHASAALRPGGTLVADNCGSRSAGAAGFLAEVAAGPFETRVLLPLRDGILIAVRSP